MNAECMALQSAAISFDDFFARTRSEWEAIATMLMRRWRVPEGVEHADVVQELMLGAWSIAPRYEAARGATFERFIVYNAIDKTTKWMHKQRNALRRDGKAPSRFPIRVNADLGLFARVPVTCVDEAAVDARLALRKSRRRLERMESLIIALVLECGYEETVERLTADDLFMVVNRLETREAVERLVLRLIAEAVEGEDDA